MKKVKNVHIKNLKRRNLSETFKAAIALPISELPTLRLKNLDTGTERCIGVTEDCELSIFELGEEPAQGFFIKTKDILSDNWVITNTKDEVLESAKEEDTVKNNE
jgi:hypothetical protein